MTTSATMAATVRMSQPKMPPRIPAPFPISSTCRVPRRLDRTLLKDPGGRAGSLDHSSTAGALQFRRRHFQSVPRRRYSACRSGRSWFDLQMEAAGSGQRSTSPSVREPNWRPTMKFMVIVKASNASEAGHMPSQELLTAMGKYNEELAKAGIMLAGEGLHPSSKGVRVRFSGSKRTVIDGPFAETKELIAGFWLWQVGSKEEAIEWLKRCPNPHNEEADVEIRQIFEAEDFGAEFTPELRAQEERIRAQTEKLAKGNKR